jgi:phage tail sheath gpL-like
VSGSITFTNIPVTSLLVPMVAAEVDASGANTSGQIYRGLIIAMMSSAGNATPGAPVLVSGTSDAGPLFGIGSMAYQMVSDYRNQDGFGELWVLPIAQPTGSAGTGSIAFSGTATASGTLSLYIAGQRVPVSVSAGDTAATVATNVAAAINASVGFPVTAVAATSIVTLTAVDLTQAGADIDIRLNYGGNAQGEATPLGLTPSITAFSGGVANPSIATGLAALGAQSFDFILAGLNDASNLALIASLLNDASGRWSWEQELFGHGLAFIKSNLSSQASFAATLNNQHVSVFGAYETPWPAYRCTADAGGAWAVSCRANPALPVQNIPLNIPAPALADRFDISDRNVALTDGVSTIKVVGANQTVLERMVTTYTTNAAGAPDNSYRDVETLDTLTYLIRDLRTYLATVYARKILVADGTPINGGSAMTTARLVLADVISRYQTYCNDGLAQNYATFAANARAENQGNGIVAMLLPFDLANQLRVLALKIAFTKS